MLAALGRVHSPATLRIAELWMRDQGVVAPLAFANMLSPGLSDPP